MKHPFSDSRLAALTLSLMLGSATPASAQSPGMAEPLRVSNLSAEGMSGRVLSGVIRGPRQGQTEWRSPSGEVLRTGTACATNDWKTIAAGGRHVLAVKTDGSL